MQCMILQESRSCQGQEQLPSTPGPARSSRCPSAHQKGRMTKRVMMNTAAKTMKMLLQVFLHPA